MTRWRWLAPLVVAAIAAALSARFLAVATAPAIPGGWDGVPQYAIAKLYSERLFPTLSGWLPEYFAGMPFPDFYPPIFYLLTGALARLGLSVASAYYVVVTASVLALPVLVSCVAGRVGKSALAALVAGTVAVAFIVGGHSAATLGGTLAASFTLGLSTHALGLDALVGALFFLAGAPRSGRDRAGAAICLGLVPMCNVHVAWDAALVVIAVVGVRLAMGGRPAQVLRVHAPLLLLAALVPLCWLLPMIVRLPYVPTKALEPVAPGSVLRAYLHHFVYLGAAAWLAQRRREPMAVAIVVAVTLVLGFALLPLHRMFEGFSIQPWRVLAAFEPLAAISIGVLVSQLAAAAPGALLRAAVVVLIGAGFLSRAAPFATPDGLLPPATIADYTELVDTLGRAPPGRVLAEMGMGLGGGGFSVQSLVGAAGGSALTTVFREASISSLFANPLRNALSDQGEVFGIDSKLDGDAIAIEGEVDDATLARLASFGVTSVAVFSDPMIAALSKDARFTQIGHGGAWRWFALRERATLALVPARGPVLTFARFSVKPRPADGHDFVRLGEEAFARAWLDTPLALTRGDLLDEPLARFPALLVVEGEARDPAATARAVERYLHDGGAVVILEGRSALHAALGAIRGPRVRRIQPAARGEGETETAALQRAAQDIAALFAALDALLPAGVPRPIAATLGHGETTLQLPRTGQPVPVWVRQTYFPDWQGDHGEAVYLASPSFQLTFGDGPELRLRRTARGLHGVAWAGTLFGLLGCVTLCVRRRRRR